MKIDPQKALRTMAAAGCVFLGSSAVLAQSDEKSDKQRDRQESRDQDKDRDDESRNETRNRDRDRSDREDRREARRDERSGDEKSKNRSRDESRQAKERQDTERPGLGVSFATEDSRPVIRQVHPGSPAEEMGLRRGDRITHVNGEEVSTARDVIEEVRKSEPGDDIELKVTRDGDERSFEGELETRREALVLRGDRNRQRQNNDSAATAWNSDRSERRSYSTRGGDYARDDARGESGRSGRGQQDVNRQLDSLERQVQQIRREINQLRRMTSDSDSYGRSERQAGYSEYGDDRGDEVRTSYSYEGGQAPEDGFRGRTYRDGNRGQESDQENSPGGVVGGARTRPDSGWIDNR